MQTMQWKLRPKASEYTATQLAQQLSHKETFPPALANILLQRKIDTYEAARAFFVPDVANLHAPLLMRDMDKAVARLLRARSQNEMILLLGDYDVDGTSSVTLLALFLEAWGFRFDYYIPDRYKEGYGVSYQGIDYAAEIGATLIISLDCGIKAVEKVRYAAAKEIDFIICDHHKPGTSLPEAVAVLDPKRADCTYPFKELSGCGVGFKLVQALHDALCEQGLGPARADLDPLKEYADLLALSIACDIVPMIGENRILAYYGLKKIQEAPLPGLKALMDQALEQRNWDISDLVFFLGPRVNSAGRLGHARDAVEVLLGKTASLAEQAEALQESNDARKDLDRSITQEALHLIASDPAYGQKSTTVLCRPEWHKGVIGIVASRLVEHHYRPTILLTQSDSKLVGSARSVPGFDLYEALSACTDHLLQFGGHKYAAGLSLKPEAFPDFCKKFDEVVAKSIRQEQKIPNLYIDQLLAFSQIDARFIRLLNRLAPFGPENRKPIFVSESVWVRHVRLLKEQHVKMVLEQEGRMFEAIGFNLAEKWAQIKTDCIHVAFQPIFNQWKQQIKINLRIKDVKPAHEKLFSS